MWCRGPGLADAGPTPGVAADAGAREDDAGPALDGDGGDTPEPLDAGDAVDPPDAGEADGGARACAGAFDGERRLVRQGRERRALVYVPDSAAGREAPLVVSLHGFSSNPEEHRDVTHFRELAEARGFIVAFPAGVSASWNGGACCGPANVLGVDDVGFVRALVAQLSADFCVDARRVHVAGFSNGGFLAHRVACEAADVVASVGVVAGQLAVPSCTPARPVPLAQLHGTLDPVVPFTGNPFLGFPPTMTTVSGWAARDGCASPSVNTDAGVQHHRYAPCAGSAEVELFAVEGKGHDWFGGGTNWDGGGPVDASRTLLDFFERHPMP